MLILRVNCNDLDCAIVPNYVVNELDQQLII
jgi:hypothetical protein